MTAKKLGTPPTKAAAQRRIRDYLKQCDEKGRRPTRPGLRAALGVSEAEMEAIEAGRGRWRELREIVGGAMDRIRDELEQGQGNVSLLLLKQPCYGGYTDKPENRPAGPVRVIFGGEKGGEYGG